MCERTKPTFGLCVLSAAASRRAACLPRVSRMSSSALGRGLCPPQRQHCVARRSVSERRGTGSTTMVTHSRSQAGSTCQPPPTQSPSECLATIRVPGDHPSAGVPPGGPLSLGRVAVTRTGRCHSDHPRPATPLGTLRVVRERANRRRASRRFALRCGVRPGHGRLAGALTQNCRRRERPNAVLSRTSRGSGGRRSCSPGSSR